MMIRSHSAAWAAYGNTWTNRISHTLATRTRTHAHTTTTNSAAVPLRFSCSLFSYNWRSVGGGWRRAEAVARKCDPNSTLMEAADWLRMRAIRSRNCGADRVNSQFSICTTDSSDRATSDEATTAERPRNENVLCAVVCESCVCVVVIAVIDDGDGGDRLTAV